VEAKSNFIVYRNRLERQTDIFAGERHDVLRENGDSYRIAKRRILLDQGTLLTSSLSFFF
jgi:biphenyl 2,3-dioxygenase beta subunit